MDAPALVVDPYTEPIGRLLFRSIDPNHGLVLDRGPYPNIFSQ